MTDLHALLLEMEKYLTPAGWSVWVEPGWNPDPLRIGESSSGSGVVAPAVRGEEIIEWGGRRFPAMFVLSASPDTVEADGPYVRLFMLLTRDHEVRLLAAAAADGRDLTESLKALFRLRPLDWWKRKALWQLGLTREDGPEAVRTGNADLWGRLTRDEFTTWAEGVLQPVTTSQRRRNNRITPSLLREVAEVYRQATKDGRAPTMAVADYFQISRANAAKWVGRAREERILGPSVGPVGGERPIDE